MVDDAATSEQALLALGRTQVDAMFCFQKDGPLIDDGEFLPLLEVILTAFEARGVSQAGMDALWDHAFGAYDAACQEADPTYSSEENRDLMRSYLLGPRRLRKRRRRS